VKIRDLSSGLRIQISNEQANLVHKIIQDDNFVQRASLDPREVELANQMVQIGVLTRVRNKGKIHYQADITDPIWRI
jgi:hypothetical protein